LIFHEEYDYGPRGDDEGREYHYYLTIPATHFQAALRVLPSSTSAMYLLW